MFLRCSDRCSSKKFEPSIVALYVFMTDKILMMCPAVSLDKFFRMAHRNILLWGIRCFHNFTTDFKNKFVVFLDHQLCINKARRLTRPKRWVDMARDVGKESWEGKLTRLEEPHTLKIATTCFARILALTVQEFPRNLFLQSVTGRGPWNI